MINGVQLIPLTARVDDRGALIEVLRATDPHFTKFGQVYFVASTTRGTVRAFHKHAELWDWFFISNGSAKFGLVDGRHDSPTYEEQNTIVIAGRNPSLLVVPPGVYHGWMALEDNTHLISTASEVYNRENPDEDRVLPDSFGYKWGVQGR